MLMLTSCVYCALAWFSTLHLSDFGNLAGHLLSKRRGIGYYALKYFECDCGTSFGHKCTVPLNELRVHCLSTENLLISASDDEET